MPKMKNELKCLNFKSQEAWMLGSLDAEGTPSGSNSQTAFRPSSFPASKHPGPPAFWLLFCVLFTQSDPVDWILGIHFPNMMTNKDLSTIIAVLKNNK
ncbi:MAG: hypothetical protein JSW26_12630 [Desulfobacterales bacterium]|nr:MAG: hypothetical protein JSW26_12630 [Desulfobacterales bacterium]